MEILTSGEQFQRLASEVATDYYEDGKWSSFEKEVRGALNRLGFKEGRDYLHNFKVNNPTQSSFFEIDFFFPKFRLGIEVDGSIWHNLTPEISLKDKIKESWIKILGWKLKKLTSKDFEDDVYDKKLEEWLCTLKEN